MFLEVVRSCWKSSNELGSRAPNWDIWDVPGSSREPEALGKSSLSSDTELQTGARTGWQSFPELGSGAPNWDQWDLPGSPQEPGPFGKASPGPALEPQNLGTLLESASEIYQRQGKLWEKLETCGWDLAGKTLGMGKAPTVLDLEPPSKFQRKIQDSTWEQPGQILGPPHPKFLGIKPRSIG